MLMPKHIFTSYPSCSASAALASTLAFEVLPLTTFAVADLTFLLAPASPDDPARFPMSEAGESRLAEAGAAYEPTVCL